MIPSNINLNKPFIIIREEPFAHLPQEDTKSQFTQHQEQIIIRLKRREFKRIVCLIGAGISVGAGIPDFRTSKTGLFATYRNYNVPYPEALFERDFFIDDPKPLYALIKDILVLDPKPTLAHQFLLLLEREKMLHFIFTQNIDGLEKKSGIKEGHIVEAHGTLATATCLKCKRKNEMLSLKERIVRGEVPLCSCTGLIKPDVLFYEEKVPAKLSRNTHKISEADLVFIMGTSLQVSPFDTLVSLIGENVPVVVINKEKVNLKRKNEPIYFLGDAQEMVKSIIEGMGLN